MSTHMWLNARSTNKKNANEMVTRRVSTSHDILFQRPGKSTNENHESDITNMENYERK